MKKLLISLCFLFNLSAMAGQVYQLQPGETLPLSDGSIVACMGGSVGAPPALPQKRYQCTLLYSGSPGKAVGRPSYDLCEAIRSSIYECRRLMGSGTRQDVIDQFCVSDSRSWGMGVKCIDENGQSVSKPAICDGVR